MDNENKNRLNDTDEISINEDDKKRKILKIAAFTAFVAAAYCVWRMYKVGKSTELETTMLPEIELPKISNDVLPLIGNKTGETLTAERLGRKIGVSSREVNKRLIEKGLAMRYPNGGLYPTEAGKELCAFIDKETRYGYCFTGIEWDKCVADILFTPKEVENAARKAEEIKRLVQELPA
ncbi:hypothetical protein SAMN04487928_106129 [Butyrivibrio proteoclasticus]|uniref:Uncharacterized protein n=1 Tax=Butyrivibrio proteoclasticus TaxID=43305 RepID=A0A1I5SM87_9FIRM|nr:hypothetical protein [Butyrivibrio proteoclasticus]SFP71426.1 hypothetical protein SAMN04487928_106129 [Butyrivibrio proteoclasticus]